MDNSSGHSGNTRETGESRPDLVALRRQLTNGEGNHGETPHHEGRVGSNNVNGCQ